MLIETETSIYDTRFQHAQLEVTGRCNMSCKHCRAAYEANVDLSMNDIISVLDFVTNDADNDFRLTVSGGEPFLYPDLPAVLLNAKNRGIEDIIITTNGSLVTDEIVREIGGLGIRNICVQVSVDSPIPAEHDAFRRFNGAFDRAIKTIEVVSASEAITASLRATITPARVGQIPDLVRLALDHGAIRIGIGSVIPAGAGKHDPTLIMNPREKRVFLEAVSEERRAHPSIDITTEDPLKFALECNDIWPIGDDIDPESDETFGGCTAGVTGFNVTSDGTITPCAVLLLPITSIIDKDPVAITSDYASSPVICQLIERQLTGKCSTCPRKRICGGCRAVAAGILGDYMAPDPTCWM